MRVDLPFPDKLLWPNGPRPRNHGHRNTIVQKHRQWAYLATLEAIQEALTGEVGRFDKFALIQPTIEVHAKPKGPLPDRDNCIAAAKSYLDGIADALAINDRNFAAPLVTFAPERDGRFVVELSA